MSEGKQKGKGLEDPFLDKADESGDTYKNGASNIFYAYARRTDNYWASRYLLTFVNTSVCNEWWSLVQSEYPSQGVRHGPQLFSFQGDDFFGKVAKNKKFDDLATKWFYTQFGDATGTNGRTQDVIPLQDWNGELLSAGSVSSAATSKPDKGKGREFTPPPPPEDLLRRAGLDVDALAESLESMQSLMETNNAQIAQLVESQSRDAHRLDRIEHVVEETATQLHYLTKSHADAQQLNRELVEQNAKLLRELKKQKQRIPWMMTSQVQQQAPSAPPDGKGGQQLQGDVEGLACEHNVYPPPRKLDVPLVGYAYEKKPPKLDKVKRDAVTPKRSSVNRQS